MTADSAIARRRGPSPAATPRRVASLARRRRLLGAMAALAALAATSGCAGPPHPTVAELRRVPGATLVFPGASVDQRDDSEGASGVDGDNAASLRVTACTTAAGAEVIAWFGTQLTRSGWTHQSGQRLFPGPGTDTYGTTWTRGERHFTVALTTSSWSGTDTSSADHRARCRTGYQSVAQ